MTLFSKHKRLRFISVSCIVVLFMSVSSVSAQRRDPDRRPPRRNQDIRTYWKFDGPGNRYLRSAGRGKWVEYQGGRLYKTYTERNRNDEFIEMTTTMPVFSIIRVYNQKIVWRVGNENFWRRGANGGWIDPEKDRKDRRDPRDPRDPRDRRREPIPRRDR